MTSRPRITALLRQQVTQDFRYRCAYCQSPQEVGIPMVLDHCMPLSIGGATERQNLCLCCYRCNEFKGAKTQIFSSEVQETILLFNPRTQIWKEHFSWSDDGLKIVGLMPCGDATIEILHLNEERWMRARKIWIMDHRRFTSTFGWMNQ